MDCVRPINSNNDYKQPAAAVVATTCFLSLPSIEILQFLELHAAVQLLNTCRALRSDRVLTTSVLTRVPCAQHFFQGCAADWWHVTPVWKTSIYTSELVVDELESDWEDDQLLAGQMDDCHLSAEHQQLLQHLVQQEQQQPTALHTLPASTTATTAANAKWQAVVHAMPQWQHVPLLSLLDFVLARILPQCYIPFKFASAVYTARPVVIALPLAALPQPVDDYSNERRQATDTGDNTGSITDTVSNIDIDIDIDTDNIDTPTQWTTNTLEHALNAIHNGFGSDFVHAAPLASVFGVHWDNMTVSSCAVTCRTCALYETEVQQYQLRVQALIADWKRAVSDLLPTWKASGLHQMAIDKRTYELREAMVPYTGYYNSNMTRRHSDVIMQHVVTHWQDIDSVGIDTLGCTDAAQLLLALTADVRKQCHYFVKLKQAMAAAFPSHTGSHRDAVSGTNSWDGVRRMQYRLGDPWAYLNMWQETLTTELVAGVSRAGFVCGFLLIEKGE